MGHFSRIFQLVACGMLFPFLAVIVLPPDVLTHWHNGLGPVLPGLLVALGVLPVLE